MPLSSKRARTIGRPLCVAGVLTFAACGSAGSGGSVGSTPGNGDSNVREAWDPTNRPSIFRSDYQTKLTSLPVSGRVRSEPWSDSYWPNNKGGIAWRWNAKSPALSMSAWSYPLLDKARLARMTEVELAQLSPAEKYDILMGRYDYPVTKWQRENTSPTDDSWWGICHGWAPAAYLFREPRPTIAVNGDGIRIPFGSSDVKALLSFQQTRDGRSVILGQRCNADLARNPSAGGSLACRDANAGSFHVVLTNEVGILKAPFTLDVTRDFEVWNQPVLGFESRVLGKRSPSLGSAQGTVEEMRISTDLTYIVEMQPSWTPHIGVNNATRTARYEYWVELDDGGRVIGGSWISFDRPDFLWTTGTPSFAGIFGPLEKLYRASVSEGGGMMVDTVTRPASRPVVTDTRCPVGGTFDAEIGFCAMSGPGGERVALGQFTAAMIALCEERGGGGACAREYPFELSDGSIVFLQRWNHSFARAIRGTGTCPLGAMVSPGHGGYCVESSRGLDGRPLSNAFGPFTPELVEKCIAAGGGRACQTLRWNANLLRDLVSG